MLSLFEERPSVIFVEQTKLMDYRFVLAIWTNSLVTILRNHRLEHDSERVAASFLYDFRWNLRMSELLVALRTNSHPPRHKSLDTDRQVMRTINHK